MSCRSKIACFVLFTHLFKQEAGVVWEVLGTEGPGHAQEILTTLDLASWGGVVVVSGDGLVHEVYNGLLARPDWSEALGFPVGVIPSGSGNALVRSLIHWQGEPTEPDAGLMSQCVSVARANLAPIDLFVVRRTGAELRVAFLSLGWGLITDVDLDSEVLRWMGEVRFTIYGLLRMARKRHYRGTLSYVLADWPDRQQPRTMQVPIHPLDSEDSDWTSSLEPPSIQPYPRHLANVPNGHPMAPPAMIGGPGYAQSWQELDERLCQHSLLARPDDPVRRQSSGRQARRDSDRLNPTRRDSRGRESWDRPPGRSCQSLGREVRSSPSKGRVRRPRRTSEPRSGPTSRTPTSPTPIGIPPAAPAPVFPASQKPHSGGHQGGALPPSPGLDPTFHPLTATPLHKDWVTETSDFLCVYILNLPYIDRTTFLAPDSLPDDGVLWLLIVRSSVTRSSILRFMLSAESGNHVNIPGIDIFPVTAVKIQPDPTSLPSSMTVDGEQIPAGPVQCHVLPGAGRVMVK